MLDRGVLHYTRLNNDYGFPFRKIKERLRKPDILFGNLESVISDKGFDQGGPYSFRAPPEMIEGLILADFDVLSLANNHSFDWTVEALTDTEDRLKEVGITPVGTSYSPIMIKQEETTVAFLAYTALGAPGWAVTEDTPGVAWYTDEKMLEGLREAKEADITVVSIHFGVEYQKEPSEEQRRIAELAIDNGADLVIGHHPHVIQPVETYKDGIIAYSLGNFVFDQSFSEETMRGLLLEVKISDKKIAGYRETVVSINESFQPFLD